MPWREPSPIPLNGGDDKLFISIYGGRLFVCLFVLFVTLRSPKLLCLQHAPGVLGRPWMSRVYQGWFGSV
jgi:hypothetical protein